VNNTTNAMIVAVLAMIGAVTLAIGTILAVLSVLRSSGFCA
jgi:hypothetical protein